MTNIVFIDTETTSLRHDRRAWEIALITRTDDGDTEHQWFIETEDLDLGNADPKSLAIGRFYDRHPAFRGGDFDPWGADGPWKEAYLLRDLYDAVLAGAR